MYHGVPVVGVPLFGDHYDTMTRVAAKGMGIMLHWKYMTEEDLFTALSSVITDTRLVCLVLLCVLLLLSVRSDKRLLGFSLPKTQVRDNGYYEVGWALCLRLHSYKKAFFTDHVTAVLHKMIPLSECYLMVPMMIKKT